MSLDSDASSQSGDYRSFRQITRDRLLFEMLRSTRKNSKSTWKVLIMDKFTVKIMSYACKMADITEEGVSLVEDLYKRRQPLPSLDAIYFIQPTKENIVMFLSDMSGRSPLYKKAYVFFSSPVHKELVAQIKKDSSVLPRIAALSEMNLEYFAIDSQWSEKHVCFSPPGAEQEQFRVRYACLVGAEIFTVGFYLNLPLLHGSIHTPLETSALRSSGMWRRLWAR